MDKFTKYPGESLVPNPDQQSSTPAKTAEECAKLCATNKGFKCKSFDFCQVGSQCILNKKHKLEVISDVKKTSLCDHYSSKLSTGTIADNTLKALAKRNTISKLCLALFN